MKVMIVTHEILAEEDARVEATSNLRIDLLCIIHEFFEFFGESDHSLCESRQQFFNQIQIFVELSALDDNSLTFEVVKGHLKVNLFKFFDESLSLFLFVQLHRNATSN